jgi:hypothetical protein
VKDPRQATHPAIASPWRCGLVLHTRPIAAYAWTWRHHSLHAWRILSISAPISIREVLGIIASG